VNRIVEQNEIKDILKSNCHSLLSENKMKRAIPKNFPFQTMRKILILSLLLLGSGSHALAPPMILQGIGRGGGLSNTRPTTLQMAKAEGRNVSNQQKTTDRSEFKKADEWLDAAVQSTLDKGGFDESSFLIGILGDLHIDPRKMDEYEEGRNHWIPIFERANKAHGNTALVSLGDLGESKNCNHNPANPDELFAGTTQCHELAAEYLGSFGVPYEVIGGNHDLEGIDEFRTDQENLRVFLEKHGKPHAHFCREIAEKTLLVGLGSTVFREAPYTSHEVIVDQVKIEWFENLLKEKPADDGWKIFVFSHAPPNGSGLRVLQENHVVNGCCWLNHSNELQCRRFIELVREYRSIKGWFSGHFRKYKVLSQIFKSTRISVMTSSR